MQQECLLSVSHGMVSQAHTHAQTDTRGRLTATGILDSDPGSSSTLCPCGWLT